MAPPRVGVELAAPGADPGGWLAEATAYEAAGVDSLWVGTEPGANPWVLLGALAAVSQGRLVPAAGGILIYDTARNVLGAIGISGDTSDRDEECAVSGVKAAGLQT